MTAEPKFRSGFEKSVWDRAKRNKKKLEYESRKLGYVLHNNYIVDMVLPNGICVECKGRFTVSDRRKMLAVIEQNPKIDIRMVFMRPNCRLTKSRNSSTYEEWCRKHNIEYAIGHIPIEWWDE